VLRGRRRARGRFTAVASRCGDGIVDAGAGEDCDDGNTAGGDGCEEDCLRCDPSAPPFASTWAAIQRNVFARYRCTGCHAAAASGGLDLRPDVAYRELVGVPSVALPALARVAGGDSRASLLWLVLAKGAGLPGYDELPPAGMPIGGRLTPADLDALGRWIDGGAPETGVVPGTDALLQPCP
jgi:cysteine-rich repeat protein